MTTTNHLYSIFEAALSNNRDRLLSLCRVVIADFKKSKRDRAASQFERLLQHQPQQMILLPSSGGQLLCIPTDETTELLLPLELTGSLDQLIAEQLQADKLRGLRPASRVLLHGPSGNGKTSIARVISQRLQRPLVTPAAPILNSYLGESEKNLGAIMKAAANQPCVLLLDEFDSIGSARNAGEKSSASRTLHGVTNALLVNLERLPPHVVCVCATNLADALDHALFRRFDFILEVPAPGLAQLESFALKLVAEHLGDDRDPFRLDVLQLGESFATARRAVLNAIKKHLLKVAV